MAEYTAYFSNGGLPATGLLPTWQGLIKRRDGTAYTPQPTITEVGLGFYKADAVVEETVLGVMDGGATLADTDRYSPAQLTSADGASAAIKELTVDATTGASTTTFEVTEITSGTAETYNGSVGRFISGALKGVAFKVTDFAIQNGHGFFTVETAATDGELHTTPSTGDRVVIA